MYMATAVETPKHPSERSHYKVWYLQLDRRGDVIGIGVKTREELIKSIFENYRKFGQSHWRAFLKGNEASTPIDIYDFISQSFHENTHFGNLPTLSEFEETLKYLQMNLELKAIS